jgi:hypothetical protein
MQDCQQGRSVSSTYFQISTGLDASNSDHLPFQFQAQLTCLSIPSAKRYERMMRAHGIAPNAATIKPAPSRAIKTDRSDSIAKLVKKRKAEAYVEDSGATDDDESFSNNIKSDPATKKEKFVKEEENVQGQQLSMHDATHLMHYYDSPSPYNGGLGGEQDYPGSEYGGSAGYATPMGGGYAMHAQQPYDFGAAYGNAGMSGISRNVDPALNYQSMMQFPSDPHGRPDSPVIVE